MSLDVFCMVHVGVFLQTELKKKKENKMKQNGAKRGEKEQQNGEKEQQSGEQGVGCRRVLVGCSRSLAGDTRQKMLGKSPPHPTQPGTSVRDSAVTP